MTYTVTVGNLGTVIETENEAEAVREFHSYVDLSGTAYGRVSGESVVLFKDGEPIAEKEGTQDQEA